MLFLTVSLMTAMAEEERPRQALLDEKDRTAEEVVLVWPDKFARWRDTRWLIATEVVIPSGFQFARTKNAAFQSFAFQAKAVVHCDEQATLGARRLEVLCEIEDVGLQASTYRRQHGDRDRRVVQSVLDELDEKLTGASIQLQVNQRGAVTNIGMEGLDRQNRREGMINESLRVIAGRLMFPFNMKLPQEGVTEGHWPEFNSSMMSVPNSDAFTGSSTIVHYLDFHDGHLLVQDIGDGVAQVRPRAGLELHYDLDMSGVSVFDIESGIMEERVWAIAGTPSGANETLLKYWYTGRIAMLDPTEQVDVGPSMQVAYPGLPVEGLPDWTPVDPGLR